MPRSPGMGESGHGRLGPAAIHGAVGLLHALWCADSVGEPPDRVAVFGPPGAPSEIGQIGQRHAAVLMPLGATNRDLLALTIEVAGLQCQCFA